MKRYCGVITKMKGLGEIEGKTGKGDYAGGNRLRISL